ncbi:hypothetical protein V1514DRAFT_105975 [Lipomyces japonicus]|uniref:uncharacterized protein n=1 Tax=Lipomyces japonicus TaxID=56871 RepID=UPI0034CDE52F
MVAASIDDPVGPVPDHVPLSTTISATTNASTIPSDEQFQTELLATDVTHASVLNVKNDADKLVGNDRRAITAHDDLAQEEQDDDDDKSIVVSPLNVSLLLVSGIRGEITIDREYLKRHAVEPCEPENLTILILKTCIWADWKDEWGTKPISTEYIRLIHFGRLLDDQDSLGASQVSRTNMYNVLHMSVRPVSIEGHRAHAKSAKHKLVGNIDRARHHVHHNHRHSQQASHRERNSIDNNNTNDSSDQQHSSSGGCTCIIL